MLGICLLLSPILRGAETATAPSDVVMLPKFVVTGEAFVFSMSWRCKWPTQKSKITKAWFTDIPKGGWAEKAGLQTDDLLLKYDDTTLSDVSGEWLSERLKKSWTWGQVHQLLIERKGKKMMMTIEMVKNPNKPAANVTAGTEASLAPKESP